MNKVAAIFSSLRDDELKEVVLDLRVMDETGVLPDGSARRLCDRLVTEAGILPNEARNLVFHHTLRVAAFRWADQ
jgi:hypothetical protein